MVFVDRYFVSVRLELCWDQAPGLLTNGPAGAVSLFVIIENFIAILFETGQLAGHHVLRRWGLNDLWGGFQWNPQPYLYEFSLPWRHGYNNILMV